MKLADLFEELSKKEFQNPDTGNLFFPAYIYTYPPEDEYQIRNEIDEIKDRLRRPNNYQELMVIDIYKELIEFMKNKKLGNKSLFELNLEYEKTNEPSKVIVSIERNAKSPDFLKSINSKIVEHFQLPSPHKKVYVLVHGFGSIFPYLRASEFIKKMEGYIVGNNYKIIILYPGEFKNNHYYLFNEVNNEDLYRAILLNKRDSQ